MVLTAEKQKDLNDQLLFAAAEGRDKDVRWLLAQGAEIHAVDQWQSTPLHVAAMYGGEETANVLLQNGARLDVKDHFDRTPEAGARYCNQRAADILEAHSQRANAQWENCGKPGWTPEQMTPEDFTMVCNLGQAEALLALDAWDGHSAHAGTLMAPLAKDVQKALAPAHARLLGQEAARGGGWRR